MVRDKSSIHTHKKNLHRFIKKNIYIYINYFLKRRRFIIIDTLNNSQHFGKKIWIELFFLHENGEVQRVLAS